MICSLLPFAFVIFTIQFFGSLCLLTKEQFKRKSIFALSGRKSAQNTSEPMEIFLSNKSAWKQLRNWDGNIPWMLYSVRLYSHSIIQNWDLNGYCQFFHQSHRFVFVFLSILCLMIYIVPSAFWDRLWFWLLNICSAYN